MNQLRSVRIATVILFLLTPIHAWADEVSPEAPANPLALLNRCYSHLTQRRLPLGHPLRAAVLEGMSAVDACLRLLDAASLNTSGANEGVLKQDTEDGRLVLRALNDFHRTWFPRDDFDNLISGGNNNSRTDELHDTGEPGLHYTRALFTDGARLEEVVTGNNSMEAIRSMGPVANTSRSSVNPIMQFMTAVPGALTTTAPIATDLVQKGELLGVRPIAKNPAKRNVTVLSASTAFPLPISLHRSSGGGIIGTRSFLLGNLNLGLNQTMDGGLRMPREFSKTILSSFLCREIPVIRTVDAVPYVQTAGVTASTPTFRTNANCMGCHATVDPMASVARNFTPTVVPVTHSTGDQLSTFGLSSAQIYERPVNLPKETTVVDSDANFARRPPTGRFYFRNYKGELLNEPMVGVSELGRIIASTEDFYVCAASRYLQFFTGIKVALDDPGDPNTVPPTPAEKEYRDLVTRLGLDLKSHQNLKTLVRQIIESPLYQSSAMRLYGEIQEEGAAE